MICLKTQYFSLNRILLLAIGLWPYQQSKFTQCQFIFLFGILSTCIIFMMTPFITFKCTGKLVITIVSTASFFIILLIKYCAFRVNIKAVKKLLIKLQDICNELKDKNEIAIIEEYGYVAKRYTLALITISVCGVFIYIISQSWLTMPDIFLMMNVSRLHYVELIIEYFFDQEQYFSFIILQINIAVLIGITALIAIGTTFHAYFALICGIFKVSSYRIECAIKINILHNFTSKSKISRSENLISAVQIHRQAIKLTKRMLIKFNIMFFCLAEVFVISLCCNFVQNLSSEKTSKEVYLPIIIVGANIIYLFLANSIGQDITDHNAYVFATVYKVQWYVTPIGIQKMLLFLLQKGTKDFIMNVGGFFFPSLECFAMLMKASVSYFTVILSTQ